MKIQKTEGFKPISITLESLNEVCSYVMMLENYIDLSDQHSKMLNLSFGKHVNVKSYELAQEIIRTINSIR